MINTRIHLITNEMENELVRVDTEMDTTDGDVTATLHIEGREDTKVVLTLDYPNWATIRDSIDSHFQDFEVQKQVIND